MFQNERLQITYSILSMQKCTTKVGEKLIPQQF